MYEIPKKSTIFKYFYFFSDARTAFILSFTACIPFPHLYMAFVKPEFVGEMVRIVICR